MTEERFWIVWSHGETIPARFPTRDLARKSAEHLSVDLPEKTFYVAEVIGKAQTVATTFVNLKDPC